MRGRTNTKKNIACSFYFVAVKETDFSNRLKDEAGSAVYVGRESSQMVPLCIWTEREQSNGSTVYVDRESSQMVALCMWTERAVKW